MLTHNHVDPERLSALASGDGDATADRELAAHVAECGSCATVVAELGALRDALAALPDLPPSRPLRLLPEVEPADRPGGWARRLFGPAMAAGAALALVGMVGTAAPMFSGAAAGVARDEALVRESTAALGPDATAPAAGQPGSEWGEVDSQQHPGAGRSPNADGQAGSPASPGPESSERYTLPAERSAWPMVLFTGVALMAAAALLRWILVPRAG